MNSAVIVLYESASDSIILTKRTEHLAHHPGEICFPGGRWEEKDNDLYATALRELNEELGIEASRVNLIKKLLPEKTILGSIIHPWLATIPSITPFYANEFEVASLTYVPMVKVKDPKNYQDFLVERNGLQFTSLKFTGHHEFIWGATARIMRQLSSVCFRFGDGA